MMNYEAVERIMESKGLTRTDLARSLGMPPSTVVGAFNRRAKRPFGKRELIEKVAQILDVSVESIEIYGSDPDPDQGISVEVSLDRYSELLQIEATYNAIRNIINAKE